MVVSNISWKLYREGDCLDIFTKKIIFVGGKGGVGKSTTSAAIALESSSRGYKTLLISTDPAHNVGHIFDVKIGGKISVVETNLHAVEIDPERDRKSTRLNSSHVAISYA